MDLDNVGKEDFMQSNMSLTNEESKDGKGQDPVKVEGAEVGLIKKQSMFAYNSILLVF